MTMQTPVLLPSMTVEDKAMLKRVQWPFKTSAHWSFPDMLCYQISVCVSVPLCVGEADLRDCFLWKQKKKKKLPDKPNAVKKVVVDPEPAKCVAVFKALPPACGKIWAAQLISPPQRGRASLPVGATISTNASPKTAIRIASMLISQKFFLYVLMRELWDCNLIPFHNHTTTHLVH